MAAPEVCPKCGGEVVRHLRVVGGYDGGGDVAAVAERPGGIVFNNDVTLPLVAHVCTVCGFTEL